MKRLLFLLVLTLVLVACGNKEAKKDGDDKSITVGASPAPHAEILEEAKPLLKEKGYDLKVKTINDYTTPNKLLDAGELDANFFQHTPYLDTEKKDKKYKIESVGNVHLEPMAVYSKKHKSLKDLPKGAEVFVSNNPAEEGRFLKFFVDEGLIKLKDGVKIQDAKFDDIVENKKDIKFNNKQSAEFLPKTYQNGEGDAVIINSNFAIEQKLNPQKDSIALENPEDNPYANLIAVQEGQKDSKKAKALLEALQSKEIQEFIKKKYNGAVIPATE
ncbi:MetQ/NlpA family ABC transporter substrate-binding protein [Staphylococcus massiliensis]|uniref:MetQ/NlpA family ABC transporter substrate-binding protein n=1 Tax=Staphylococcus massiliensis TaxID=555791 RepID=UPI001EDD343E|nr:MetQ/NlpA family ABC transporter substrate-binding protein [Staphylococcus massiliensis]MCG3400428.1 MetQ/NlpA family ABC transporter substrate-binding protein [Staphylococcus massiliensis]MCG3401727.1 MetQ/NlpA family ABC transporter substrate-binding protein [Staphylococcus massiliensis]MCG3413500.1 MetQ/NlpA family ABC transporter substrate-binding protein [Staphylococcus massiliensis]